MLNEIDMTRMEAEEELIGGTDLAVAERPVPDANKETLAEAFASAMPVAKTTYTLPERVGLIIVDEINGFCTVGAGPLAPLSPNAQVDRMIEETDILARRFVDEGKPVMVFRDTHVPGRSEPPYPPHCEIGSGQEELVERLGWLVSAKGVILLNKDVINGLVGGIRPDGSNAVYDWVIENDLEAVVFQGICTDICVLDAVVTMLSARNHYIDGKPMLGSLRDVVVHEPGCATYDMTLENAMAFGLPDTAVHPQELSHHIGLVVMQARGALIAATIA